MFTGTSLVVQFDFILPMQRAWGFLLLFLRQGVRLYSESQQTKKMADYSLKITIFEGTGLIPGWGTKGLRRVWPKKKKEKEVMFTLYYSFVVFFEVYS